MKYLLLDTNIYLNIIVNRRKDINQSLIENFMKLLKYGEIKLIVPSLVRHEVYKHMEEEINKVKFDLEHNIKSLKQLYWINGLSDADATVDIESIKKEAIAPLNTTLTTFDQNANNYKDSAKLLLDKIFEDENTLIIEDDSPLITQALQRQIYKKAPCHIDGKNSAGDALIAAVLINLPNYIPSLNEDVTNSTVYFVTDNYKDFSNGKEPAQKNCLHDHISNDIALHHPKMNYKYFTGLSKLISIDLKEEVTNAHISEDFERDLEEQEHMAIREYLDDYEENIRESCGLPSLSSFNEDLIEQTLESDSNISILLDLFDSMNSTYNSLEEKFEQYESIINDLDQLQGSPNDTLIIERFNEFIISIQDRYHCYTLEDVIDWINEKKSLIENDYWSARLPDSITFGEDISILTHKNQFLYLHWKNTDLSPTNGGSDCIDLECYINSNRILSRGSIEIDYGFGQINDDGNIEDAADYNIELYLSDITSTITDIQQNLDILDANHQSYLNFLTTGLY